VFRDDLTKAAVPVGGFDGFNQNFAF